MRHSQLSRNNSIFVRFIDKIQTCFICGKKHSNSEWNFWISVIICQAQGNIDNSLMLWIPFNVNRHIQIHFTSLILELSKLAIVTETIETWVFIVYLIKKYFWHFLQNRGVPSLFKSTISKLCNYEINKWLHFNYV